MEGPAVVKPQLAFLKNKSIARRSERSLDSASEPIPPAAECRTVYKWENRLILSIPFLPFPFFRTLSPRYPKKKAV